MSRQKPPPDEGESGLVRAIVAAFVQGVVRAVFDILIGDRGAKGLF